MNLFQQLLQKLVKQFTRNMNRGPNTPFEWMELQNEAVRMLNKTKGVPSGPKKPPFQGWKPKIIEGGKKPAEGIPNLLESGKITLGKTPKTKKITLDSKKEKLQAKIEEELWIKRKQAENKEAIRRFKEKNSKTVEDFRDKGDWDPGGMASGGLAPLLGEPTRTPMKKGKRRKKKKKVTAKEKKKELIEDLIKQGVPVEEIKVLLRMLPRHWDKLPHGEKRYKKKKDLPEGILELLQKDPGFDWENFKDTYWAGKGWRHTDTGFNRGLRGSYSPSTGNIELNLAPFGEKEYVKFKSHNPHTPDIALTDTDKAKIALHELRHKNILEDRELFMTQPEWVQKSKGSGYIPSGVTGHELYDRFLDQRYYPPEEKPGKNEPYFDKILKDHWEPYAKAYEARAKARLAERRGEGIETLAAQGGRIGMAGGGPLFKFIEQLFIKASNQIRRGQGKWKGLDQKQRIIQHDNLTKKVVEFEKTGNTEGLEVYFDVNPHEAFAEAEAKAKRLGKGKNWKKKEVEGQKEDWDKASKEWNKEWEYEAKKAAEGKPVISLGGVDERTMLKQKYPGISDDLVEKILIDDNPQRKADVLSTIDQYMKLREIGKSEAEAYDIITRSFSKNPTKHAEGGRIGYQEGGGYKAGELKHAGLSNSRLQEIAIEFPDLAEEVRRILAERGDDYAYGGRIGYAGGGKTGLPAVTMGTPQMNMQQPQMPAGPQPAGIPGGTIVAQNQMQQNPWMGSQMQQGIGGMPQRGQPRPGGMPRPMAAGGGRIGFGLGGISRRAFMKWLAGITGAGIAGGAGLLKLGSKAAPKAIKETAEVITRGADGSPKYIYDLIEVVKAKGTRDIIEGFKKSDYSTVHSYKGVDVIEHPSGATSIKKQHEGGGTYTTSEGVEDSFDGITHEIEMNITPGEYIKNKKGKMIKAPDEYVEYTAKPDMDGKLKDVEEYIDDMDHLDLKKIADEKHITKSGKTYYDWTGQEFPDLPKKTKKASGGLAYALGE